MLPLEEFVSAWGGICSVFTYTEQQLSAQDRKIIRFML